MNEEQMIRAKALEIAISVQPPTGLYNPNKEEVISQFLPLAATVERYIRGELQPGSKT
jgi:hypothetical protein